MLVEFFCLGILICVVSWIVHAELRAAVLQTKRQKLIESAMSGIRPERLGEITTLVSRYGFSPEVKGPSDYWDSWLEYVSFFISANYRLKVSLNAKQEVELRLFDLETDRSTESHVLGEMYLFDGEKNELRLIKTFFNVEFEKLLADFNCPKKEVA